MNSLALAPALPPVTRRIGSVVLLSLFIAGFISLAFGEALSRSLVYSLCIGLSCQVFIELGILGLARWRERALPASARTGWPGWVGIVVCVLLGAMAGLVVGTALADAWTAAGSSSGSGSGALLARHPRALTTALAISLAASVACTWWFYSREQLRAAQARAETASRAATEAQLRLLESQLEPHMLFNTLANLRALIAVDPARAQAMLDRLIAYLRATLSASRAPVQALQAEFDRLEDYLALMAVRMGDRLAVRIELPAALREHPVPSLLLQPLVENAVRHGLEPKVGGGRIEIGARRDGDSLRLTVRDTGVGLRNEPTRGGFGTLQVRERLRSLHGDRAGLALTSASDGEGGTVATITLPWTPSP